MAKYSRTRVSNVKLVSDAVKPHTRVHAFPVQQARPGARETGPSEAGLDSVVKADRRLRCPA
jgi:hypothetical protein